MTVKNLIKSLAPPCLWDLTASLLRRPTVSWKGDFPSWQDAKNAATGYDTDTIIDKSLAAALKVRNGEALWERDSVLFFAEQHNLPLLAYLLRRAIQDDGKLHVLDYGGSFGSTYFQHRRFLSPVRDLSWSVVEQHRIVELGQNKFANGPIHFFYTAAECATYRHVNVILFSSVLQYLEDPYHTVEQLANLLPHASIIVDRTPLIDGPDRITLQRVRRPIYEATYPCRFLNRSRLTKILSCDGRLVSAWSQDAVGPTGFMIANSDPTCIA